MLTLESEQYWLRVCVWLCRV